MSGAVSKPLGRATTLAAGVAVAACSTVKPTGAGTSIAQPNAMQWGQPELLAAWLRAAAGIWWQPPMLDAIDPTAAVAGVLPFAAHGLVIPATRVMAIRSDNTNRRTTARATQTPP